MSPYRQNQLPPDEIIKPKLLGLRHQLRTWWRKFLIWQYGDFLTVYSAKCPECGMRSWDPEFIRINECNAGRGKYKASMYHAANYFKCGHHIPGSCNYYWE